MNRLIFFIANLISVLSLLSGCTKDLEQEKSTLISDFELFIDYHNQQDFTSLKQFLPNEVLSDSEKQVQIDSMTRFIKDPQVISFNILPEFQVDTIFDINNGVYARISYTSQIKVDLSANNDSTLELMSLENQLKNDSLFWGSDNVNFEPISLEEKIEIHHYLYARKKGGSKWEIFNLTAKTKELIPAFLIKYSRFN